MPGAGLSIVAIVHDFAKRYRLGASAAGRILLSWKTEEAIPVLPAARSLHVFDVPFFRTGRLLLSSLPTPLTTWQILLLEACVLYGRQ